MIIQDTNHVPAFGDISDKALLYKACNPRSSAGIVAIEAKLPKFNNLFEITINKYTGMIDIILFKKKKIIDEKSSKTVYEYLLYKTKPDSIKKEIISKSSLLTNPVNIPK